MDITQLILDDHYEQRRLFAMLEQISPSDTEVLAALWGRLAVFLELHAAAEEAIFYPALAAANLANSDHMAEEEREGLTDFRRLASLQRRHDLAVAFAAFEARNYAGVTPHDRDPAEYVREAEEDLQVPPGGSLSIGSLKKS